MKKLVLYAFVFALACKKNVESPVILSFTPTKGAPGITVKIYGIHFDSVANNIVVYFNGVAATPYFASDSSLSVQVPPGASTGKITVKVDGRSVTSKDDFVILPGQWTQKLSLPNQQFSNGRGLGIGFSIGSKGYLGMGTDNGSDYDDLWEYDPTANIWTQKASMGIPMESLVAFVINDKAYAGIGKSRQLTDETVAFFEYDPSTDSWTRKSDFPGVKRSNAVGFGIGDKGYVGLGFNGNDWWEYDPVTDTWTKKADFPQQTPPTYTSGFVLNNKVYIIGGEASVSSSQDVVWEYDPVNDAWTQKGNYPGDATFMPCGFSINGKGYIMGGGQENWEYDPATDTWTQKAFFADRLAGSAFAIADKGYFGLGSGTPGYFHMDFWEFSPH